MELTAEATITKCSIKSEKAGYYGGGDVTVLDLAFTVRLPKPTAVNSLEQWAADYGNGGMAALTTYRRKRDADKIKKDAKDKKKNPVPDDSFQCEYCSAVVKDAAADDHDCPESKCVSCGQHQDDCTCDKATLTEDEREFLAAKYAAYAEKMQAANRVALEAAQRASFFIALINMPVRVTLAPVQEGMLLALDAGN